jgi:hypothetical protein
MKRPVQIPAERERAKIQVSTKVMGDASCKSNSINLIGYRSRQIVCVTLTALILLKLLLFDLL